MQVTLSKSPPPVNGVPATDQTAQSLLYQNSQLTLSHTHFGRGNTASFQHPVNIWQQAASLEVCANQFTVIIGAVPLNTLTPRLLCDQQIPLTLLYGLTRVLHHTHLTPRRIRSSTAVFPTPRSLVLPSFYPFHRPPQHLYTPPSFLSASPPPPTTNC